MMIRDNGKEKDCCFSLSIYSKQLASLACFDWVGKLASWQTTLATISTIFLQISVGEIDR